MAKKKAGSQPKLSPENYIRKRARMLPLHKCYINSEWEESNLAYIIVARKHASGNITMGLFLVDLACLGVKDSFFRYNIFEDELDEMLENMQDTMEMVEVPYALAHNIIYGALDFAEEYGFKPVKEFTSVTAYILEEDTDDIEWIEIEFGQEGKPFYCQGPNESDARARQILKTLEETAGPGNYTFLMQKDAFDEEDEDEDAYEDDEDFFQDNSQYNSWEFDEKKERFLKIMKKSPQNEDELKDYMALYYSILFELYDKDELKEFFDQMEEDLTSHNPLLNNDEPIPDALIGVEHIDEQLRLKLQDIYLSRFEEPLNKPIKEMRSLLGKDVPFLDFLEIFEQYKKEKFKKLVTLRKNAEEKYPDSTLFKLTLCYQDAPLHVTEMPYPALFFKYGKPIHPIELNLYLTFLLHSVNSINYDYSLEEMEATTMFITEYSDFLYEEDANYLAMLILFTKLDFLHKYLTESDAELQ